MDVRVISIQNFRFKLGYLIVQKYNFYDHIYYTIISVRQRILLFVLKPIDETIESGRPGLYCLVYGFQYKQ